MVNLIRRFLVILLFFSHSIFAQESNSVSKQIFNSDLHSQLPSKIRVTKQILAVNAGTFPPYVIHEADGTLTGAAIELFGAVSEILGVSIKHEVTGGGAAGILMGIQSGRYDLDVGPMGDIPERRPSHDLIAYSISYDAAVVLKGNPANIHSRNDFCGNRAGVVSGSLGEKLMQTTSQQCVNAGKRPINLLTFKDRPTMIIALKSGRIDGFSAGVSIISYFVGNSNDELEMVSFHKDNEPYRYFCAVVAKDSALGPIILAALQELYANGTYARIMEKWHMQAAMLDVPGINLAK